MALDVYREWLKIESAERPPDYYTLLGLNRFEDDRATIQKHYRQRSSLVRRYAAGKYALQSQDLLDELARAMLTLTDPSRKAQYDRRLGRKPRRPATETRPLGRILVEEGYLTAQRLQEAEQLAAQLGIELRDAVVQKGFVGWEEATRALAQHYNMPYVDPGHLHIRPEAIGKVPATLAIRENLFPLLVDEDSLFVAVTHALNVEALDSLRFQVGMPVRAVLCSPPAIRKLIQQHYRQKGPLRPTAAAPEPDQEEMDEEPQEPFSLAGWLWRNVKWLLPAVIVVTAAVGYLIAQLAGAVLAAAAGVLVLVVLLFTVS